MILVPTGEAPHKRIADDPGRELRMAMTRLAAADDSRFSVSSLEVEREGPSYTYETLELLAKERGDTELVFVMGADAAVGLESWREPERVVELARLAVARRAGISDAEVGGGPAQPRRRGQGDDAGDAAVRRLLLGGARAGRGGRPLRYLVPEPVARFIEEKGIYSMSAPRSEALARRLAELADSKKAEDIVVLDMRELVAYTDFLASAPPATSARRGRSSTRCRLQLKRESGLLPGGVDGGGEAGWIVLDYLDCVLHVFTAEARDRYQLEDLWREAPRLELDLDPPEAPSAASA